MPACFSRKPVTILLIALFISVADYHGGIASAEAQAGGVANPSPNAIDSATAQIVMARAYTSSYALRAQGLFKVDSAQYQKSFELYTDAFAKYSAWDAYVVSAIKGGRQKTLVNNDEYTKIAKDATDAAGSFIAYVSKASETQSKDPVTVVAAIADLAIKIWSNLSDKKAAIRNKAADDFAAATSLKSWADLAAPAKVQPATPQSPSPASK